MAKECLLSEESCLMAGTSLVETRLPDDSTIQQNRKLKKKNQKQTRVDIQIALSKAN